MKHKILLLLLLTLPGFALQAGQTTRPRPVEIKFLFDNDNKFLGLWYLTGKDGDDYSRTHQTELELRLPLPGDVSGCIYFSSTLFTRWTGNLEWVFEGGEWRDRPEINFLEESIINLSLDSRDRKDAWYWRGAIGLTVLNGEKVSIGATGQQKIFHDIIRPVFGRTVKDYIYASDGFGIHAGLNLEWMLGLEMTASSSGVFLLPAALEAGYRWCSLRYASRLILNAAATLQFPGAGRNRHGEIKINFPVSHRLEWFPDSRALMHRTAIGFVWKRNTVDFFLTLHLYYGDANNEYYHYNRAYTSTSDIGVRFKI